MIIIISFYVACSWHDIDENCSFALNKNHTLTPHQPTCSIFDLISHSMHNLFLKWNNINKLTFKLDIPVLSYVYFFIFTLTLIRFVSDLRQVSGFLRVLRFPSPIKLSSHFDNRKARWSLSDHLVLKYHILQADKLERPHFVNRKPWWSLKTTGFNMLSIIKVE